MNDDGVTLRAGVLSLLLANLMTTVWPLFVNVNPSDWYFFRLN